MFPGVNQHNIPELIYHLFTMGYKCLTEKQHSKLLMIDINEFGSGISNQNTIKTKTL
jgi:hypothetical protein